MSSMAHIPKRPLAMSMTVLMLLASAAPALSRMTCVQSGHAQYSVADLEVCCLEIPVKDHTTLKAQCCVFGKAKAKHPDMAQHQLPVVPPQEMLSTLHWVIGTAVSVEQEATGALFLRPPPLTAPERLALICTLRV